MLNYSVKMTSKLIVTSINKILLRFTSSPVTRGRIDLYLNAKWNRLFLIKEKQASRIWIHVLLLWPSAKMNWRGLTTQGALYEHFSDLASLSSTYIVNSNAKYALSPLFVILREDRGSFFLPTYKGWSGDLFVQSSPHDPSPNQLWRPGAH